MHSGFGIAAEDGTYLGAELPEQPPAWCTHWADQGSIGAAGINFLVYELGYLMLLMPDPNHRTWNDLKGALKRSRAFFYRTVVLTTLVFNLSYSPFLKGNFFDKKKEFYDSWKSTVTVDDPLFKRHAEGIAEDHGLHFPQTEEEWAQLLDRTKNMKNCLHKGPLVKMMRPPHDSTALHRIAKQFRDDKDTHNAKRIIMKMHSPAMACRAQPLQGGSAGWTVGNFTKTT